jgi:hypothetical protein
MPPVPMKPRVFMLHTPSIADPPNVVGVPDQTCEVVHVLGVSVLCGPSRDAVRGSRKEQDD